MPESKRCEVECWCCLWIGLQKRKNRGSKNEISLVRFFTHTVAMECLLSDGLNQRWCRRSRFVVRDEILTKFRFGRGHIIDAIWVETWGVSRCSTIQHQAEGSVLLRGLFFENYRRRFREEGLGISFSTLRRRSPRTVMRKSILVYCISIFNTSHLNVIQTLFVGSSMMLVASYAGGNSSMTLGELAVDEYGGANGYMGIDRPYTWIAALGDVRNCRCNFILRLRK